jgi:hypothetical protein
VLWAVAPSPWHVWGQIRITDLVLEAMYDDGSKVWINGVTVTNPFKKPRNPLLERLLV